MALLTAAQVREQLETDLTDAALQRLIDDADAAIVTRYGPHAGPVTVLADGGSRFLYLPRPADTAQPVTIDETAGGTTTRLAADDWRPRHSGRTLERLATGTNRRTRWGDVEITYTPADTIARRTRVLIDLVKLAVEHRGLASEAAGDWQARFPDDYQRARERILSELDDGPALV